MRAIAAIVVAARPKEKGSDQKPSRNEKGPRGLGCEVAMRARKRGHIVSIGSIADHVAFPENSGYVASKFGLRGLHEVLRAELHDSGVRATLISPGPVNTALWDEVNPDERPGFTPRSAMLAPDAVAEAVMFAVMQSADVNIDEMRLSRA